jgi:hypothetical protein
MIEELSSPFFPPEKKGLLYSCTQCKSALYTNAALQDEPLRSNTAILLSNMIAVVCDVGAGA